VKHVHFALVVIHADDVVADFSEASACDEADVTGTDDAEIHKKGRDLCAGDARGARGSWRGHSTFNLQRCWSFGGESLRVIVWLRASRLEPFKQSRSRVPDSEFSGADCR
jgi:hypothetical protein